MISPLGSSDVRPSRRGLEEDSPADCSLFLFCCSIANNRSSGVDKLLLSSGGGGMAIQLYWLSRNSFINTNLKWVWFSTRTAFRQAIPNARTRATVFAVIRNSPNRQPQTGRFQLKDYVEADGVVSKTGNPSTKIKQTINKHHSQQTQVKNVNLL